MLYLAEAVFLFFSDYLGEFDLEQLTFVQNMIIHLFAFSQIPLVIISK